MTTSKSVVATEVSPGVWEFRSEFRGWRVRVGETLAPKSSAVKACTVMHVLDGAHPVAVMVRGPGGAYSTTATNLATRWVVEEFRDERRCGGCGELMPWGRGKGNHLRKFCSIACAAKARAASASRTPKPAKATNGYATKEDVAELRATVAELRDVVGALAKLWAPSNS